MLAIGILYQEAYGVAIKSEIEKRLSRHVTMGGLHTALVRLEDKKYVRSFNGERTEERMGRPRRYYQITSLGKKALEYTKDSRNAMWKAIPKMALGVTIAGQ